MKVVIEFDCDTAAFYDDYTGKRAPADEVKRILRNLAERCYEDCSATAQQSFSQPIYDLFGNAVGRFQVTGDDQGD